MCYQRVKTFVMWFAPTRKQLTIVIALIVLALILGSINERRRLAWADRAHAQLQEQIDRLASRISDLERKP